MVRILTSVLALLLTGVVASAAERKALKDVDMGRFAQDTQGNLGGDRTLTFVWWIPVEYWEVSLAKSGAGTDPEYMRETIKALRPYILLAIVKADVSKLGGFTFASREAIAEGLRVGFQAAGKTAIPLVSVEPDDPDVNIVLGSLRPVLANAIGPMGQNMHFFTLTDSLEDGVTPISPYEAGEMTVEFSGETAAETDRLLIYTPMDSLFVPRECPGGRVAHVSWIVCPWDGTRLKP